ncbi:MAG: non-ribosomal peptide synthetase [Holophagaceae bacterium]|nr:non-ribosomal peptide synthetase [Holophagaceae bacterium]
MGAQPAENLALLTQDGYLTYGELNARANQLARALLDRGLDQAAPIGICLERSADFVVAILGVLRAGHPYLPFDARQPRNRIAELLQEARGGALLTHGNLFAEGTGPDLPILRLDRERRALAREATAEPGVPVAPEDLAYCLFTSGSTGRPKCVEVTHGGLAAYPRAFNARLGIDAEARYLHGASFAFSASLRQLFVPLSVGATVALATVEQIRDPLGLLRWVKEEELTVLDWVPSYLRQVCAELERLGPEARRALTGPQVRILVSSGEALSWPLVRRWREAAGFTGRIANAYGQTETTGLVAWCEVGEVPEAEAHALVPLGAALHPAELYALDEALHPLIAGGVGDLWVAGPCVARGYRGGAALPKRPNPFSPWPELYATGDRVRVAADGTLIFEGRADDQVKVHGVRLALGEVEEALRSHPAVRDAAVLAVEEAGGETRLHAFLEPMADAFADEQAVRRHLRERCADHLVPHAIRWLPRLPRTASGKADRPALRAALAAEQGFPDANQGALVPASTGPSAETVEAVVRAAWTQTLGTGLEDGDFFELGGDSLQVIAMLGHITTALKLDTPLIAAFFGEPTLPGLLRTIRAGLAAEPAMPLVARPRVPRLLGPGTA